MATKGQKTDNLSEFRDKVKVIEEERGSRIFCIIHHGRAHICSPTMSSIYANRAEAGTGEKVEILIHSGGGHPDLAFQVMKFFRRRFKEVNVIVPLVAKSAATLMCLGADKVYMGEFGDLGPIDIQIDDPVDKGEKAVSPLDEFKSLEYMRDMAIEWLAYYTGLSHEEYGMSIRQGLENGIPLIAGLMRPMLARIDPLQIGSFRRSLAIAEEYGKRMLELTGQSNDELVHNLVWEYPSHSFCIDYEEAEKLGLPVERLSEDHDKRLGDAIFGLERQHYHGFASSKPKQPKPAQGTHTKVAAMLGKKSADGTTGGTVGASDDTGKGTSETTPASHVKAQV